MKKSIVLILILAMMLSACGNSTAADPNAVPLTETEEQQWLDAAVAFTESMEAAAQEGGDMLPMDDPVYGPAIDSWITAMEDVGTVQGITGESVEFTDEDGRIVVHVDGTDHDAEVVLTLGKVSGSYDLTNVAVNVIYSFAELMQQAALNTVLGMGTTFAVLILLALIIMLFGKILNRTTERQKAPAAPKAAPAAAPDPAQTAAAQPAAEIPAPVEENLTADLSLVAVIAAAVAAYEGKSSTDGYVVRSIRKSRRRS